MGKNMKQDIIRTYYELVAQYGIENTSLAKVAKQLGVNTSLIFHYFENKEELVTCFFEYVLEECRAAVSFVPKAEQEPWEQFEDYLNTFLYDLQYSRMGTNAYYTCYVLALQKDAYYERFMEHRHQLSALYERNLLYFQERGIVKPGHIKQAANYLEILTDGLANMRDFPAPGEDSPETIDFYRRQIKYALNYQEKG